MEQSQANIAAANLRAIWAAEQWWWLENGTYTGNLQTDLANTTNNNNLIDPQIATATTPYKYSVALGCTWQQSIHGHRHPAGKPYMDRELYDRSDGPISCNVHAMHLGSGAEFGHPRFSIKGKSHGSSD